MKRWTCPVCDVTVLAPKAPPLEDVRRFCLPCSAEAGFLVRRVVPATERAKAAAKTRAKSKPAPVATPVSLSVDDLSLLVGAHAAWAIWYQPERARGQWRGTTLRVPATLFALSDHGTSLRFFREDTGAAVDVTFRPTERRGWVRDCHFRLDGWRLNRNVFVSLADEAPPRKLPEGWPNP